MKSATLGMVPRGMHFQGDLTPAQARALLKVGFTEEDHSRMEELSVRASAGTLTPHEQAELDLFEHLGLALDMIHSRARQVLGKKPKRAS